jgi:hypothetical protein
VQNRSTVEIEFRMNRLSVRLERLAAHFEELVQLLAQGGNSGNCLKYVQECKFLSSGRGSTSTLIMPMSWCRCSGSWCSGNAIGLRCLVSQWRRHRFRSSYGYGVSRPDR